MIMTKRIRRVENFDNLNQMDDIIQYIQKAINARINAVGTKSLFSDVKYQNQILPLKNALSYANYIKTNGDKIYI